MCIATAALQAPSIVAFVDNGSLRAVFVVGDMVHTKLTGNCCCVKAAVLVLLCLYYIFVLDYPRPYSMFMTLRHCYRCLQRPRKHTKSKLSSWELLSNRYLVKMSDHRSLIFTRCLFKGRSDLISQSTAIKPSQWVMKTKQKKRTCRILSNS